MRFWRIGAGLLALAGLGLAGAGCSQRAVARVNNDTISEKEFNDALQQGDMARAVLDSLIVNKLLLQEASRRAITVSKEEVDAQMATEENMVLAQTGLPFDEWLASDGRSRQEWREDVHNRLLRAKVIIPADELKKYFEQHRSEFDRPEEVIYRKIVVSSKPQAEAFRKQLAEGKDFAQLAKDRSEDVLSARRGGMAGFARKGLVNDPELEKVLFSLKPGEVSQPLPVKAPSYLLPEEAKSLPDRWELVKVVVQLPPRKATFDNSETQVIASLFPQKQQDPEVQDFLLDLIARADISIFSPRFRSLMDQYKELTQQREQMRSRPAPAPPTGGGVFQLPPPPPPGGKAPAGQGK